MKDRGSAAPAEHRALVRAWSSSDATGDSGAGFDGSTPDDMAVDWSSLIEAVARGQLRLVVQAPSGSRAVLVSESALTSPGGAFDANPVRSSTTTLTKREQEILLLLEEGKSGGEIAEHLGLAVNTVAQHLASARRRFGVRSSAEAARRAREAGLL